MDGMDEVRNVLGHLLDLIEDRPGDMFDETGSGSTIQRYPTEELRILVGRMKLIASDQWEGGRRAACQHRETKIVATSCDLQYEDHCERQCLDCGKRWIDFEP